MAREIQNHDLDRNTYKLDKSSTIYGRKGRVISGSMYEILPDKHKKYFIKTENTLTEANMLTQLRNVRTTTATLHNFVTFEVAADVPIQNQDLDDEDDIQLEYEDDDF